MTTDLEEFGKHEQTLVSTLELLRMALRVAVDRRAEVNHVCLLSVSSTQSQEIDKLLNAFNGAFSGLVGGIVLLELALTGRASPTTRQLTVALGNEEAARDIFKAARDVLNWDPVVIRKMRDRLLAEVVSEDDA